MTVDNNSLLISVRELSEFVWRAGDLRHGRDGPSALEGARAHRRLQKSRVGYRSEVALSHVVVRPAMTLTVSGRADLVCETVPIPIVEEIKTTLQIPLLIDGNNPVHWAQVKLYGHMIANLHQFETLNLQVTYLNPETDALRTFSEEMSNETLAAFFEETCDAYLDWITRVIDWRQVRNASLASLRFPFDTPRPGQHQMADAVTALPNESKKLFVEAPTGSGKTVAVLFGAVRALENGSISQLLFFTARTVGRGAARDAGRQLGEQGAALKILTLYARDEMCEMPAGTPCSGDGCPLARGHFDRIRPAMDELFDAPDTDLETVRQIAGTHRVCPYWLGRAVLPYVDLVIGDYNYFFDPNATLLTLTAPVSPPRLLLVDEAHNLPDRARRMYSADISTVRLAGGVKKLKSSPGNRFDFSRRCLTRLIQTVKTVGNNTLDAKEKQVLEGSIPVELTDALNGFIDAMNASLASVPGPMPDAILNVYFDCLAFLRAISGGGDGDRLIIAKERGDVTLTHFCMDPSPKLQHALDKSGACAVFFSATLSPIDYYRRVLGGITSDRCDVYPSHFPPDNRCVARCISISTRYRDRTRSREDVASLIHATILSHPGNYLAFFPSFAYLSMVAEVLDFADANVDVVVQKPGLSDRQKQTFLNRFRRHRRTRHLLGLAVLGGLFSEAVDLPGHQLIGTVVVSPGLPMVSFEQDLIREHFQKRDKQGFEYAYLYPGMNKVVQAAGRVHRSARDRGVILFIGQRFKDRAYAPLLERRWPEITDITNETEWRQALTRFWSDAE